MIGAFSPALGTKAIVPTTIRVAPVSAVRATSAVVSAGGAPPVSVAPALTPAAPVFAAPVSAARVTSAVVSAAPASSNPFHFVNQSPGAASGGGGGGGGASSSSASPSSSSPSSSNGFTPWVDPNAAGGGGSADPSGGAVQATGAPVQSSSVSASATFPDAIVYAGVAAAVGLVGLLLYMRGRK